MDNYQREIVTCVPGAYKRAMMPVFAHTHTQIMTKGRSRKVNFIRGKRGKRPRK